MKYHCLIILSAFVLMSCQSTRDKKVAASTAEEATPTPESIEGIPERNPAVFLERFNRGIDFVATGNEPFWSVDIDFEGSMHFKHMDGAELILPTPPGDKDGDADTMRYAASDDNGAMVVQVIRQKCTDTMSGYVSEFVTRVEVTFPGSAPVTYEGCGQYLGALRVDLKLHGNWQLVKINETQLDSTDFAKGLPQLSFDLPQKRVYGHTGCNNVTGSIEVQDNRIEFAPMIATKMACPGMEFEYDYLRWFPGNIAYEIEEDQLRLMVSDDSTFIYQRRN